MDGNKCIVSDDTPRDVTWSNTQQTYTFTVKQALKNPALEITYGNEPNKRSTWGDLNPITRKPQNSKAYNRNKSRSWKREMRDNSSGSFYTA